METGTSADGRRKSPTAHKYAEWLDQRGPPGYVRGMCRNIRPLFNFEPPATDDEVRAAALQYVRKVSGTRQPRGANQGVFERAVDAIAAVTRELVDQLETTAPPKNREIEAAKARARSARRYVRVPRG
jgi:hypothetical protein